MKTSVKSIRFDETLWEWLKEHADANYTTIRAIIMRAVVEYMERQKGK